MNKPFKSWRGNRVKGQVPPLIELVRAYKKSGTSQLKIKQWLEQGGKRNWDYRLLKILFLSQQEQAS